MGTLLAELSPHLLEGWFCNKKNNNNSFKCTLDEYLLSFFFFFKSENVFYPKIKNAMLPFIAVLFYYSTLWKTRGIIIIHSEVVQRKSEKIPQQTEASLLPIFPFFIIQNIKNSCSFSMNDKVII